MEHQIQTGPLLKTGIQASANRAAQVISIGGPFEITDREVPQPVPVHVRVAVDVREPGAVAQSTALALPTQHVTKQATEQTRSSFRERQVFAQLRVPGVRFGFPRWHVHQVRKVFRTSRRSG
ncbi:hypothetical protein ACIA8E_33825 [Streptomyces sp. NPDC051664]|uniref:hypothetical protein n=1 Tax=Streptomyces sp. NPDC051664 TaxID=3365668 RepID=UPI00379D094A